MVTISLDLRQRILSTYDEGDETREEVARRFRVSLGFVKKLLSQRRCLEGDIAPQHHRSGAKPTKLREREKRQLVELVAQQPDRTLTELRERLKVSCTIQAIHYALQALGLTYKKRVSGPANKTAPMSPGRARSGASARAAGIRRG